MENRNNQSVNNITNSNVYGVNVNQSKDTINELQNSHKPNKAGVVILTVISICLLVWNIVYTSIRFPSPEYLKFDYSGVIVAIFSLLIMILISWQIFSYLYFVKNIKDSIQKDISYINKKIDKNTNDLNERYSSQIESLKNEYSTQINAFEETIKLYSESATGISLSQMASFIMIKGGSDENGMLNYITAFMLFCNGITLINSNTELSKEAMDKSISNLKHICKVLEQHGIRINDSESIYFNAALKTGDQELIELVLKVIKHPDSSENPEQKTANPNSPAS